MKRVVLRVASAATLVGALSACSADPEPRFADPTPTPTPTSTPTSSSSAATPDSPQDVPPREVVRAWVNSYSAALASGELDEVRALATRTCRTCEQFIAGVGEIKSNGGTIETTGWDISQLEIDKAASTPARPVVRGLLRQAAGTTFPSAGAEPFTYEAREEDAYFRMAKRGGSWKVDLIYFKA